MTTFSAQMVNQVPLRNFTVNVDSSIPGLQTPAQATEMVQKTASIYSGILDEIQDEVTLSKKGTIDIVASNPNIKNTLTIGTYKIEIPSGKAGVSVEAAKEGFKAVMRHIQNHTDEVIGLLRKV